MGEPNLASEGITKHTYNLVLGIIASKDHRSWKSTANALAKFGNGKHEWKKKVEIRHCNPLLSQRTVIIASKEYTKNETCFSQIAGRRSLLCELVWPDEDSNSKQGSICHVDYVKENVGDQGTEIETEWLKKVSDSTQEVKERYRKCGGQEKKIKRFGAEWQNEVLLGILDKEKQYARVIMILSGGSIDDIKSVKRALESGIHVIVLKGSGGVADILSSDFRILFFSKRSTIHQQLTTLNMLKGRITGSIIEDLSYIVEGKWNNLNIFPDIVADTDGKQFRRIVFHLLVSEEQLHRRANKSDMNQNGDDDKEKQPSDFEHLQTILKDSIDHDDPLVFELLAQHDMLKGLSWDFFRKEDDINSDTEKVGAFCRIPSGNYQGTQPQRQAISNDDIAFVWCVLHRKVEISMILWQHTVQDPIAAALLASFLLEKGAKKTYDEKELLDASRYTDFACGVLDNIKDIKTARDILEGNMEEWKDQNLINMGINTNNHRFMNHKYCKKSADALWYGRVDSRTSWWRIAVCLFLFPIFPLVLMLISFDEESKEDTQKKTEDEKRCKPLSGCKKLLWFYESFAVKHLHNAVKHVIFLMIFTYCLLLDYEYTSILKPLETLTMILIIDSLFEEIVQFCFLKPTTLLQKLTCYISDSWNVMDFGHIILFIAALILKLNGNFYSSKICFSFSLFVGYVRILQIFVVTRQVGPQLIMIGKMVWNLIHFLSILLVTVVAYSTSVYSIQYPSSNATYYLFKTIIGEGYWALFGEIFSDDGSECSDKEEEYSTGRVPRCPIERSDLIVSPLKGIYLFASSIVLLNLVVAIFCLSIAKVEAQSEEVWSLNRYKVLLEYNKIPPVPPVISLIISAVRMVIYGVILIFLLPFSFILFVVKCKTCSDMWVIKKLRKLKNRSIQNKANPGCLSILKLIKHVTMTAIVPPATPFHVQKSKECKDIERYARDRIFSSPDGLKESKNSNRSVCHEETIRELMCILEYMMVDCGKSKEKYSNDPTSSCNGRKGQKIGPDDINLDVSGNGERLKQSTKNDEASDA